MIQQKIKHSKKEKKYIRDSNSHFNKYFMDKTPAPALGVKFGQNYVDGLTNDPNHLDHTYQKFEDKNINLKCTIKVCKVLNNLWKKPEWWKK